MPRKNLVYDLWYRRVMTEIMLRRELKIPFLDGHAPQNLQRAIRPNLVRFADFDDLAPLF